MVFIEWKSARELLCIKQLSAVLPVRHFWRFTMGGEDNLLPRQFDVVIERDEEGYYIASVPQLPGCHTQARSLDEVTDRIREAIELCLEVEGAPQKSLEFIGIQRITVAA